MLHPNEDLKIPSARSHLIKYAAINKLLQDQKKESNEDITLMSRSQNISDNRISHKDLLTAIGADRNRLDKLQKDMSKLNKRYSFLDGDQMYALKSHISGYWDRVFSAAIEVCDYIFNTPANEQPLILNDSKNIEKKRWITLGDIDYLVLVMIYALLHAAWEKNILITIPSCLGLVVIF